MWASHIHPRSQTGGKKKKKKPDTHTQFLCLRNINAGTCHIYPDPSISMEVKSSVLCYMSLPPYYSSSTCLLPFFTTVLKDQVREVTMVTIVTFTSAYHWANWMVCSTQISTAGKLPNLVAADLHSCPWTQTHHPRQVLILTVLA
jgi:hypothetical protein